MGRKGARDRCIQEFVKRGEGLSPQSSPPPPLYTSLKKAVEEKTRKMVESWEGGGEKDVFKLTFLCSGLMGYGSSFILHIREKVTWQNCHHMLINF